MKRAAQTVGCVLDRGAVNALPASGEIVMPTGPRLDEASWRARRLWTAALVVTLADARGKGLGATAHREMAQGVARSWLRRSSEDRDMVLTLAGIDVGAFESRGLPHLEAVWREIDELKLHPRHEHTFRRKAA